jgi:predicted TIM-barrel fold metal-dependent hydrolase
MRSQQFVMQTMERFEIDAIALISGLGVSTDFAAGNQILKEVVDENFGIYGYATLNTSFPEESIQEQRLYLNKRSFVGALLIGEPGKPVALKAAREILNAQRRYLKPVAIITRSTADVHAAQELAEEFNQMKLILLSMGGDDWRSAVEAAKRLTNITLELSGSWDSDKITVAANALSSRRLIFGSGLPYGDPNLFQELIKNCPLLTTGDKKRIFLDNALALYQIDAEVE